MNALLSSGLAALAAAGAAVVRTASWRAAARGVRQRLGPPGPGGAVTGAEPILLEGSGAVAVLALHGFGDTPQSLGYVATACHERGWTVHVPLLPGHGHSLEAFAASGAADWERGAREALKGLLARHRRVAIVGQSMGAALGALLAAGEPRTQSCVWLAPLISTTRGMEIGARFWWLVWLLRPALTGSDRRSIHDPAEAARARSYGSLPVRLGPQLVNLVHRAVEALPRVTAPTLVLQSREDNRVEGVRTEAAFGRIGSPERELRWVTGAGHVIAVDYGHAAVCAQVTDWIAAHAVAPAVHVM
ncbi:MAG: alpha/beta fold hydrolase [Gemmatimonadetes bacterium]|nr:alpha/beta fold hydrolase [Gemmatimonadota bacterium]